MKKIPISELLIFILIVSLISCFGETKGRVNKIDLEKVNNAEIVRITPNGRSSVTTTKKESLESIVRFINSLELKSTKKIIDEPKADHKYEIIMLGKERHYINFYGKFIKYNGTWYEIKENIDVKLNSLINSL
ncbi:hypothetical protein CPJCM30710_02240 [Clostridium polyendosporum]|uniref:Lipoprotein n=1 Tax=Clostridium polyendosporum TaxID=69208 RepID=A0A919VKF1_9CLOT|nr:hypothetical protein [Clostridium polyendosporum]GIM27558.1 hypothetical protein CPJCM30710_02240 [Clostridium polyendosporum]